MAGYAALPELEGAWTCGRPSVTAGSSGATAS
jgi:hypothetical protein